MPGQILSVLLCFSVLQEPQVIQGGGTGSRIWRKNGRCWRPGGLEPEATWNHKSVKSGRIQGLGSWLCPSWQNMAVTLPAGLCCHLSSLWDPQVTCKCWRFSSSNLGLVTHLNLSQLQGDPILCRTTWDDPKSSFLQWETLANFPQWACLLWGQTHKSHQLKPKRAHDKYGIFKG